MRLRDNLYDQMYAMLVQYSASMIVSTRGPRGAVVLTSQTPVACRLITNRQLLHLQPLLRTFPMQATRREYAPGVDILRLLRSIVSCGDDV